MQASSEISRYSDIVSSALEMVEPILVNDGLSSGSESQHFNISEYLKFIAPLMIIS